ncbi:MAG: ABC transporter ATP-binding protein/permease [Acidimicrobiia bacterium]|nr:ABC transporter ATP-binding protein/permease [Acidimicrobiia bacterium]
MERAQRRVPAPFTLPRPFLAAVVALSLLQAASLVAILLIVRSLMDDIGSGGRAVASLRPLGLLLGASIVVNVAARFGEFWFAENMGYAVVRDLRMRMYGHLQSMSPRQIQGRARGGLLLRFTGDLSMLRTWISRGIGRGISASATVAAGIAVIAVIDGRMALGLAGVLILGTGLAFMLGPKLRRITKWVRKKRSLLTSNIDEQVHALSVVQVFGRLHGEFGRLSRQNDSMTRSLYRTSTVRGGLLAVGTTTGWLGVGVVLWVGLLQVEAGRVTVGALATAVLASRHLAGSARRMATSFDYWQRAQVSRRKIVEFMNSSGRPFVEDDRPGMKVGRGRIELRGVSLSGAFHGIDATVEGGRVVAIMGPSGAGKSSLLSVIAGLEEPSGGEVIIDGQPMGEHSLASRFRRIGMVSPDLPLMRGTIARNIAYRHKRADRSEIDRIVTLCQLDRLITDLPGGLRFWVYEGGRNLSVGERQRIALARAMLGNPPILLLDEPTTGLDPDSRHAVRQAISRHQGTILLVTHDPEEAQMADEIWWLENGRIVDAVPVELFRLGIREHRRVGSR